MKKVTVLLFGLLLISLGNATSKDLTSASSAKDSLRVFSTPDLYNLSLKWSGEYSKLFPDKPVKVTTISDNTVAEKIISQGRIAFISSEYPGFGSQSLWKVVVGRDVVVPVINANNPFMEGIIKQGISHSALAKVLKDADTKKWGTLLGNNEVKQLKVFLVNDGSVKSGLAEFLKCEPSVINATEVPGSIELISAIQKDPYAIGFCKMINVVDFKTQSIIENIRLLPIDRNENGTIDYNEKIYDDFNIFSRGVWIGKYPKELFSNIYSVSGTSPQNEAEVAFLKWVLTDGQQYLYDNGYSDLLLSERQSTVDKLYASEVYAASESGANSLPKIALIILASIIATGLAIDLSVRLARRKKAVAQFVGTDSHKVLNESTILIPKGILYDKTHTWAFMEKNGIVKVGIDDFLQHVTGPITRLRLKSPGKKIRKGEALMSVIQNGKQLNLYAPVSGTIVEKNELLDSDSSVLNSSPYDEGWVYKIEPDNWNRESQLLFMAEKQREHIKNEFCRLRDFLAAIMNPDKVIYAMAVLQDGGELTEGVLRELGPEVWEDFQTRFIDPSKQVWFYEII